MRLGEGILLLTDGEIMKAWDSAFAIPMNFDHKPTAEELFTIRLKAVAQAQLEKVMKGLNQVKVEVKK